MHQDAWSGAFAVTQQGLGERRCVEPAFLEANRSAALRDVVSGFQRVESWVLAYACASFAVGNGLMRWEVNTKAVIYVF